MNSTLQNKRVLVTGAAMRIGRSIVLEFAKAGAKLVLHHNKSQREANSLLREIGGEKSGHSTVSCDFRKLADTENLLKKTGRIDILINNASIYEPSTLSEESISDARIQFDINFWAPLILMQSFSRQKLKSGCIINILDRRIAQCEPGEGSYEISKKALADATISAALSWAPRIRVNSVAPGAVLPPVGLEKFKMKKQISMTPMKKCPRPEDVAKACIYLAENESITGQIIFVDGGQHLN